MLPRISLFSGLAQIWRCPSNSTSINEWSSAVKSANRGGNHYARLIRNNLLEYRKYLARYRLRNGTGQGQTSSDVTLRYTMQVSSTEWMIPAVHPFSAESGPHEIRGHVIIDVNWLDTPNITSCATLSYEGVCNAFDAADIASIQKLSYPLRWGRLQPLVVWPWYYQLQLSYPLIWGRLQPEPVWFT